MALTKDQQQLSYGAAEGMANARWMLPCSCPLRQIHVHILTPIPAHVIFFICVLWQVPQTVAERVGSLPLKSRACVNTKIKSASQGMIHQRKGNVPGRGNVTESCGISTYELSQGSGFNGVRLPRICSLFLALMFFIFMVANPNIQSLLITRA